MRKAEALRLKPGDKVQEMHCDVSPVYTVQRIIPRPTLEEPRGTFPLIVIERGAWTYRILKRFK